MGFPKLAEDIREQVEINLAKITPERYIPILSPVEERSKCIFCNEEFQTDDGLFEHMRSMHNAPPVVMQLNGRILEPGEYVEVAIESLRLFPVDNIDSFTINEKVNEAIVRNGYINMKSYQDNDFETLTIEVDGRKWTIYRRNINTVSAQIDDIISALNKSVVSGERPDLNRIKSICQIQHLDVRDQQYVDGFFDYCLACLVDGTEKDRLYFQAYNKLLPYIESNSRARLVIKIISLRYLWIDRLSELCKKSTPNVFSLVCDFFKGSTDVCHPFDPAHSDEIFEIFVEDDEYRNTLEIVNFMNKEYEAVNRYLGETLRQAETEAISPNLRDKVLFLKGRVLEIEEKNGEAQYYLKKIKNPSIQRMEE